MPALSFCPHLPCLLLCLYVHRKLSIPTSALLFEHPAPMTARATNTTTITAVLPKNKRESVRHHPLDLFHTRAPTSLPDGVAFFQGSLPTPRVLQNGSTPSPLSPLLSCPSSTCSAATRPWPGHVPSLSRPGGESY